MSFTILVAKAGDAGKPVLANCVRHGPVPSRCLASGRINYSLSLSLSIRIVGRIVDRSTSSEHDCYFQHKLGETMLKSSSMASRYVSTTKDPDRMQTKRITYVRGIVNHGWLSEMHTGVYCTRRSLSPTSLSRSLDGM